MKPTRILKTTVALLATCGLAGSASAQTCVESPTSLIGWWPGDGSGAEVSANLDATLVNNVDYAPGFVDDAFSLNGLSGAQDGRVVMPRLAADGLADLTVEFWVNTTDTVGALFSGANGNSPGGNELLLFQGTAGLVVWVKQKSSPSIPTFISDGAWHHVAFAREGNMGRLYVDSMLIDTREYPEGPLDIGPRGLMIGQEQDCLAGCFQTEQALDGRVDEVAVYGRALSDSEIRMVFDAGSAGKCKPAPAPAPADDMFADQVDALGSEIDMLTDRLTEVVLQLEALTGDAHSHETQTPADWMNKRRRHHDDDRDADRRRRHSRKHHRR